MAFTLQPKYQRHSIVLVGNFNPIIFQPAWFGAEKLIGEKEREEAKIEIIHSDVAIFSLGWGRIEVMPERFLVNTTQEPYYEVIRDLAMGTFTLLHHTPITRMGLNWEIHFQLESEELWHKAGDKLVPKEIWNEVLEKPGMRSLTVNGIRKDGLKGSYNIKVEPSTRVQYGLYININDHFETEDPKNTLGSDEMIGILKEKWSDSHDNSNVVFELLLK